MWISWCTKKATKQNICTQKIALKVIMNSRTTGSCKFNSTLIWLIHLMWLTLKKQTVLEAINDTSEGEKSFFDDNKLVIEVDELGHKNRDIDCKTERQKAIEKDFGWKFIRINPVENDYIISYISKNQLKIINREDPKKTITIRI